MISLERMEKMMSKILAAPFKLATTKLLSAMNELLCQDYENAFASLNKVIDLAEQAFHYTADKNLDKESFRDITKMLKMAAFAKIMKYSFDREKRVFRPYFSLEDNQKQLISAELETLGKEIQ